MGGLPVPAAQNTPVNIKGAPAVAGLSTLFARAVKAHDMTERRRGLCAETETAGHSGLQYDAGSDTYTYVWKTSKESAGTCLTFVLGLTDDTLHTASFQYAS